MKQALMFYHYSQSKPENHQVVWLWMEGEDEPVPAQYIAGDPAATGRGSYLKKPRFMLLGNLFHRPRDLDGWSELEPPENMNTSN